MPKDSPIGKLTDAVFGFALAVGALSLTIANPKTAADVVAGLSLFSLSFVILVVIWWGTSDLMSRIDQDKPMTVFFIIVLLFFVAIEPYLLNTLSISASLFPLASTLYALDMSFLMGVSAVLCHILIKEKRETLTTKQLRFYTMNRDNQFVFAGLFLLSILPQFSELTIGGVSIRVLIWFTALALSVAASARNRNK
jgi:uncharacterized membrane protein